MENYKFYINTTSLSCPWQTHVLKNLLPILKKKYNKKIILIISSSEFDVDIEATLCSLSYVLLLKKKKHYLQYIVTTK